MGLLLNVDYGDYLARVRGREVLRLAAVDVGLEEAVESYYVHYRRPIFGGRSTNDVWGKFLLHYVNSPYYQTVAPITRLNHRGSREAAVRLLRAFVKYVESLDSRRWAWWGGGRQLAWVEAMRQLYKTFGSPADVERYYHIFRKLGEALGKGRRGDPAALALSVASDPARLRLAEVLAKSIRLATKLGAFGGVGNVSPGRSDWEFVHSSVERLKRVTLSTKLLYSGAPHFFLQRLATATLTAKRDVSAGERGVYLLVDKSGSMYSSVGGVQKIVLATAYALATLRRVRNTILRFFDTDTYSVENLDNLVEVLTRVTASGGTDITKAVERAVEEADSRGLGNYALQIVTDCEDDHFHPAVVKNAGRHFKNVTVVLVGDRKPPAGVRVFRLTAPGNWRL